MIAEVRAHVVDHGRDLRVAERYGGAAEPQGMFLAERRHVAPSHQQRQRHVLARCQGRILCKSRIMSRPHRASAIGHVTSLAYVFVDLPAVHRRQRHRIECDRGERNPSAKYGCRDGRPLSPAHAAAPACARWFGRPMASSAEVTAPSCHAGRYEACSPASTMRPSNAHKLL